IYLMTIYPYPADYYINIGEVCYQVLYLHWMFEYRFSFLLLDSLISSSSSLSWIKDFPQDGIISFSLSSHLSIYWEKLFSSTSRATDTETEAPGDSPSIAMTESSSEWTISVPNWMNPRPCSSVSLMTCTRLPASSRSQSSSFASGTNLRSSFIRSDLSIITCWMEYWISERFLIPAEASVKMLSLFIDLKRSIFEPYFRNLGPIAANGPKSRLSFPLR